MSQLAYTQNAIIAQPGMVFDVDLTEQTRVSRICDVVIPFGAYCEINPLTGNAIPAQAATTLTPTVTTTAASAAITFSAAVTLPMGQPIVFSGQPGVVYYLAAAIAAGTAGTLTVNYSGTAGAGQLASLPYASTAKPLGIAIGGPLVEEEAYVPWNVPVTLSGTVTTTSSSTAITFTVAQTLVAGQMIVFSQQPGVIYFLAANINAGTAGVLTQAFSGTGAAGGTATVSNSSGTCAGYRQGRLGAFLRQGRIWTLGDGAGTAQMGGPINIHHSSTGANAQGVFTFTGFTQTVGNEIDPAPGVVVWQPVGAGPALAPTSVTDQMGNTFFIYPVEINI